MAGKRTIKAAAAQLPGLPLARADDALDCLERAVREAGDRGVDLLVLPECAYPAYYLRDVATYRAAGALRGEAFVARLRALAAENKIHLVCGFVEEHADKLFNAAVVIDADGRECGRYRKLFLWGDDNEYFHPGRSLSPIPTPLGNIGVLICADGRAPEIAAGLVRQGAQLIAVPTCWVNVATTPGAFRNAQAEFMIAGRALECGVPFVAANKFGRETDSLAYCGWSVIYDATGNMLAQAAPDDAALIVSDVRLAQPRKPDVPDWARRRIFSNHPPVLPDPDSLEPVKIAVVPARLAPAGDENDNGRDLFHRLRDQGVQIIGATMPTEDAADRLDVYGRALGMSVVAYPFVERLMCERFGSFGCVSAAHMKSFVPARVMALDGAAIVFVTAGKVALPLLRTRAAENRVFVAAALSDRAILIDPDGAVLAQTAAPATEPIVMEIDLRRAANKEVFARTHIWQQRQPTIYAKAFNLNP